VSGEPDEGSSRRRALALLLAGLLALVGAGAGISNRLVGRHTDEPEDGVDLSVDYVVTPDAGPTPTPTPGGGSDADAASVPPAAPTTDDPGRDPPSPGDPDDRSAGAAATVRSVPTGEPVAVSIPPVSVEDVDPGDGGTVDLSLTLSGSPARLWVRGAVTAVDEGGTTEAERSAGDTTPAGELQEHVRVRLWYDGDPAVYDGSLAGLGTAGTEAGWLPLTTTCVPPGVHTARFRWDLPFGAPNTVQTDGVSFSLGIAADTGGCA
jgi:hypothetical protein